MEATESKFSCPYPSLCTLKVRRHSLSFCLCLCLSVCLSVCLFFLSSPAPFSSWPPLPDSVIKCPVCCVELLDNAHFGAYSYSTCCPLYICLGTDFVTWKRRVYIIITWEKFWNARLLFDRIWSSRGPAIDRPLKSTYLLTYLGQHGNLH